MDTNNLTIKARSVARCMSYNEDDTQATAKHLLREMAHRLDTQDIRVIKKKDGIFFINGIGKSRFATIKESILYRVFGIIPKVL
jgi:hypothetical protein